MQEARRELFKNFTKWPVTVHWVYCYLDIGKYSKPYIWVNFK
jgi:hypothetical protein